MTDAGWQTDLEGYIRQGEPDKVEKTNAWKTAIGLQDVDGLKTSDYLLDTAKAHIEGKISISDADKRIQGYYEERSGRNETEADTKEADIVSVRIAKLLGEKTFQFSPAELKNVHKKLFTGVFDHAGFFRTYNITKKEWVLKGDTVIYASFEEAVTHIARFTSGIWQIHPFCEGNTRTTAVFMIRYLKTFGFNISNDTFAANSWYFRNALVRANYNNWENNIHETTKYLELFLENLLMNRQHELKNRYMHVDYQSSK